jgi:DNA-directed RNA polymerase subunit M
LKFCSECGTILKLDRKKKLLVCPKCNSSEPTGVDLVYSKKEEETDKIIIIGKKERNLRTAPQVKAKCPKCENMSAFWWMVQTRGIDESATQFYRCTKCGFTWRDYG